MVLNMISTAVMIRLGKTYSNLARCADSVAIAILEEASRELARAIAAVYPRLGTSTVPLVITGVRFCVEDILSRHSTALVKHRGSHLRPLIM